MMGKILSHAAASLLTMSATSWTATPDEAEAGSRAIILDMQRIVTPNGVQITETVQLGGMEQWISIRGTDRSNPILIYIHGGPGASELGRSWPYQRAWEDFFTVVQWDQRGTGKTLRTNGADATRPTLSRNQMADDLLELIAHLRDRFNQQQVVLLGHSWGNAIGLDAAMRQPDWVSAYIGVGPLMSMQENESIQYRRLLQIAREMGNSDAVTELEEIAPYPEDDGAIPFDKINVVRKWVLEFGGLAAYRHNADFYFRAARLSPDFELPDRQAIDQGGQLSVSVLLPEMSEIDHTLIRRTEFPVFMFLGRQDLTTPSTIAAEWVEQLEAPLKRVIWFEHSAHLGPHEEPGRFLMALVEHVLPIALASED